jgi:dephospho-CoA kinase
MIILGLTGSMAMGKSTVTKVLRLIYHMPVWDADQEVRNLLATDCELIQEIGERYPEVMVEGKVNRSSLRAKAFEDEACLSTLEHLIHKKAFLLAVKFIEKMRRLGVSFCALDVPLLFEVGWNKICTHTAVIYAPPSIQRQRLSLRPDLNEVKIAHILSRQWSLAEKKALATYEIQSGLSKENTIRQVDRIIQDIKSR